MHVRGSTGLTERKLLPNAHAHYPLCAIGSVGKKSRFFLAGNLTPTNLQSQRR